ncbi:MAG TPA: hypothetical protein VJ024_10265 [Thermodesulfovibrionales bacterium]|nr:hypothetical protein [Thermodesulfovibrionales bacterium]
MITNYSGIENMLVGGLAVGIWGEPMAAVDMDFLDSFNSIRIRGSQ